MSDILVLAEHDNRVLKEATLKILTAATELPGRITLLIVGYQCQSVVKAAQGLADIASIWVVDAAEYQGGLAESIAEVVHTLGSEFSYVLCSSSTYGKNILPRVAALFDVAQLSDVVEIISEDTFVRPIYAGDILETVRSLDPIRVLTIRATAFDPIRKGIEPVNVKAITKVVNQSLSQWIEAIYPKTERIELESARIIIAGGRGVQSKEGFALLQNLADELGAAVGASRAAVDAGWVSNDCQVGQTGKVVAPELYIAVGISGAVQHVAGIKDSKIIVAINSDPEAPIFQVADYGLVGDLFSLLPELGRELAIQMGSGAIE